jgi:hypothetical protein
MHDELPGRGQEKKDTDEQSKAAVRLNIVQRSSAVPLHAAGSVANRLSIR